jgi:hypothetical protein
MYCQEDSLPQSRTPFLCILLWLVKLGEMSWETTGPVKNRLGEHGSQEISHRNYALSGPVISRDFSLKFYGSCEFCSWIWLLLSLPAAPRRSIPYTHDVQGRCITRPNLISCALNSRRAASRNSYRKPLSAIVIWSVRRVSTKTEAEAAGEIRRTILREAVSKSPSPQSFLVVVTKETTRVWLVFW